MRLSGELAQTTLYPNGYYDTGKLAGNLPKSDQKNSGNKL
jgi:hypothetical protein